MSRVAVLGVGMSKFGKYPDKTVFDLVLEAVDEAVENSCIELDHVDGTVAGTFLAGVESEQITIVPHINYQLGLAPKPATRVEAACASGALALRVGYLSILSGVHDIVLVLGFDKQDVPVPKSVFDYARSGDVSFESYSGLPAPGWIAGGAQRYLQKYPDAREEDFALVSVKGHINALDNPKAYSGIRVTLEQVMSSPPIVSPLKLFELTQIVDGCGAAILCREDLARDLGHPDPVMLVGSGLSCGTFTLQNLDDLTVLPAVVEASKQAYAMSGFGPQDIDIAELYDCFAPLEVIISECVGFFDFGKGAIAVREGQTQRNGDMPINVGGGNQGRGHPPGACGLAQAYEIVNQLNHKAGSRQVENITRGMTLTIGGGAISTAVANIFARV